MDEVYKSRQIHTSLQLNQDTDCWVPQADVSWGEQGTKRRQLLGGPPDRFKIIEQAEIYALGMQRRGLSVDNLTP